MTVTVTNKGPSESDILADAIAEQTKEVERAEKQAAAANEKAAIARARLDSYVSAKAVIDSLTGRVRDRADRIEEGNMALAEMTAKLAPNRKPDNIPTVPEMIMLVLRDVGAGDLLDGLTPEAMLTEIRRRWWPEARSNDIGPIMWRMAVKENRLEKLGALYSLPPKQKEAAE